MSRSLTLVHLHRHPEKRHRFKRVRIWSGEHMAWWRPNSRGYTDCECQAGIYTMDEAWATSSHCCKKKKIVYQEVSTPSTSEGEEQ